MSEKITVTEEHVRQLRTGSGPAMTRFLVHDEDGTHIAHARGLVGANPNLIVIAWGIDTLTDLEERFYGRHGRDPSDADLAAELTEHAGDYADLMPDGR